MENFSFMGSKFWRKKWFLAAVIVAIIVFVTSLFLFTLKTNYEHENDAVMQYFARQPGMPDAFATLEQITPPGSVILCWWDYGRAVQQWSHREAIEAYPSRDIANSVGTTSTFWGNLQAQLFGTWGSSEKIHDLANIFMLPEGQALPILKKYNASYALVFTPDDLQKFVWIAQIAGYNATEYLTYNKDTVTYTPTALAQQTTLLRLLFDNTFPPQHFTKLYDNSRAKIYKINY
jgi:hypothetical protein